MEQEFSAEALRRILALEGKVISQVEHYISETVADSEWEGDEFILVQTERGRSLVKRDIPETDDERTARISAAVTARKIDIHRPSRALDLFSTCLRSLLDRIQACGDERARSSMLLDLAILLEVSNKAGGLDGELVEESKRRSAARARRANAQKPNARLGELYKDVEPILHEGSQNRTGQAIFKKLHQMHPSKYPASRRRTTVRDLDDLLERLPRRRTQKEIDQMWAKTIARREATCLNASKSIQSGLRAR